MQDAVWQPWTGWRATLIGLGPAEAQPAWLTGLPHALRETSRMLAETWGAALPRPWHELFAELTLAFEELQRLAGRGENPQAAVSEAMLADAMVHAVQRASTALAESELTAAVGELRARLGPIWDTVLDDAGRRYLACAQCFLQSPAQARYAGLELGLAVEHLLNRHIYEPLQTEPELARQRRHALGVVKDCRNACAHPKQTLDPEQVQAAWQAVVGDAEHGFVHYFGRAHLPA